MNKVYGGGTKANVPVIHYSDSPVELAKKRPHKVTPLCGQAKGKTFFSFVSQESVVNCEKCLSAK